MLECHEVIVLSRKGNDKDKHEENKKPIPSEALLPPELILFIKEFEKIMNQIISNPNLMSYGSQPHLFSFKITQGPEGKPEVTPIIPEGRKISEKNFAGLEDYAEVMVEGNEVTVVAKLSPHIKQARIQASGKEIDVLVGRDKVMTIKLPVKVEKKEDEIRLRNGVLTAKLHKKSFL